MVTRACVSNVTSAVVPGGILLAGDSGTRGRNVCLRGFFNRTGNGTFHLTGGMEPTIDGWPPCDPQPPKVPLFSAALRRDVTPIMHECVPPFVVPPVLQRFVNASWQVKVGPRLSQYENVVGFSPSGFVHVST